MTTINTHKYTADRINKRVLQKKYNTETFYKNHSIYIIYMSNIHVFKLCVLLKKSVKVGFNRECIGIIVNMNQMNLIRLT